MMNRRKFIGSVIGLTALTAIPLADVSFRSGKEEVFAGFRIAALCKFGSQGEYGLRFADRIKKITVTDNKVIFEPAEMDIDCQTICYGAVTFNSDGQMISCYRFSGGPCYALPGDTLKICVTLSHGYHSIEDWKWWEDEGRALAHKNLELLGATHLLPS